MLEINGTVLIFLLSFATFSFLLGKIFWEPITSLKLKRDSKIRFNHLEAQTFETELDQFSLKLLEKKKKIRAMEQELFLELEQAIQETREKQLKEIKSFYLKEEQDFKRNFSDQVSQEKEKLSLNLQVVKELVRQKVF